MSNAGLALAGIVSVAIGVAVVDAAYVVDEGRVAVITQAGKAIRQEGPEGFQFKTPFIMGKREFDVRERALSGELSAATSNQLVTNMTFSVNWRPDPGRVLDIYKEYGSPEEFASNTIQPRLQQSLKATIGTFTAVQLTRERETVSNAMLAQAQQVLEAYPAIISSVQIENFTLPERYMEAVLQKEEQREATEKARLALAQQQIEAQREVQTAEAERDAAKARADGDAYATEVTALAEAEANRLKALAEAEGIAAIQEALAANPLLVEYERVKSWDGTLPVTVMGDQPSLLMQAPITDRVAQR